MHGACLGGVHWGLGCYLVGTHCGGEPVVMVVIVLFGGSEGMRVYNLGSGHHGGRDGC